MGLNMALQMSTIVQYVQYIWIITVLSVTVIKAQVITTPPANTYVMVGGPVTLDCVIDADNLIHIWREIITGTSGPIISSNGDIQPEYVGIFELEKETNLKLLNASLNNGHKYRCEEVHSEEKLSAQLIVLKSDPVCTGPTSPIVIEGGTVDYECRVEFQGVWSPQMTWEGSVQGGISGDNSGSTDSMTVSSIQVQATIENNGEVISCLTNFEDQLDPPAGENEAINIPTYSKSHAWPELQVHYSPRNTAIVDSNGSPLGDQIYPGEQLSCISESNPAVSEYSWMLTKENSSSESVGTTESVTVHEDWLGNVTLECTVRNKMGVNGDITGEETVEESFNVYTTTPLPTTTPPTTVSTAAPADTTTEQNDPGSLSAGAIAGICIGAVLVVTVIVIIVICLLRKGNKDKDLEATKPPKSAFQSDKVRHPSYNSNSLDKPPQSNVSTIDRQGPPPYNGDYSYDSQDMGPGYVDPRQTNLDGSNEMHHDFVFEDKPRSRKPVQVYEPSDFVA